MSDEEQVPGRPGHEPEASAGAGHDGAVTGRPGTGPGSDQDVEKGGDAGTDAGALPPGSPAVDPQGTEAALDTDPVGGPYAFAPRGGEVGLGDPGVYPGTDPASVSTAAAAGDAGAAGVTAGLPSGEADGGRSARGARAWIPTTPDGGTDGHPKRDRTRSRRGGRPLLLLVGGAVVLLGLLVWVLVALFGGSEDEDRVDPSSIAAGECLADFTVITEEAVLVRCTEPHNAQLVATEEYPEDADFPGRDQLGLRAEAACASASEDIDPDVVTADLQVTLLRATPTAETWADGDRRVDCFAVVENGDAIEQSLLAP
ncbi:septum formation family protein [Arthrobacter sp. CP30]